MNVLIELIKNFDRFRKVYTSKWFIVAIPLIAFYFSQILNNLINTFLEIDQKYFVLEFSLFCSILIFLQWWLQQPPKIKTGKIGITIAVSAENDDEKNRLKNDFIREIKNQISEGSSQLFQLVILPDFFTEKIVDTDSLSKFQRLTRSHFFIGGTWKTREDKGKPVYVLNLEARVIHAPTNQVISQNFSKEMSNVFPQKMVIPKELELTEIPFTGDLVSFAAKHCIGIASLISGDFDLAYKLHFGLWNQIENLQNSGSAYFYCVNLIKRNLPNYIFQEAIMLFNHFYDAKPSDYLIKLKEFLDVLFNLFPKSYPIFLREGLYHFEMGNIDLAIQSTKKAISCSENRDFTAQYNLAFLYAFVGKLEEAHKTYKRAFSGVIGSLETLLNIEVFIERALTKYPDKIQLYYCLGMINLFVKEDFDLAKENFEMFIQKAKETKTFISSTKFAQEYLEDVRKRMSVIR
jgi:tetratricopeptide (TPR) repeat protein